MNVTDPGALMDATKLYDKRFFEKHDDWRHEYVAIADLLYTSLRFDSVLDLGCGNGFILARLHELGKEIHGVDGSLHALEATPAEIKGRVRWHDLTVPFSGGTFDLVVCTEVAEHLEAQFADTLVDTICSASRGSVYFTAATPGQRGNYHFNEQPHSYWIEKFSLRGFQLNRELTHAFGSELRKVIKIIDWFVQNSMIFERR
jgi:SAM-dependent methyltransferase